MDWRPNRRRSREYPPSFQILQENLCNEAALFIRHFDKHEQTMRQIVQELQRITAQIKDMQRTCGTTRVPAGGDTAAGSAAGVSSARHEAAADEDVEKVKRLAAEFRTIVAQLNTKLESVKTACGELRRESVEHEALNLNLLETRIMQLFAVAAELTTSVYVQCLMETCDGYAQTLGEFEKLKTELAHVRDSLQQ